MGHTRRTRAARRHKAPTARRRARTTSGRVSHAVPETIGAPPVVADDYGRRARAQRLDRGDVGDHVLHGGVGHRRQLVRAAMAAHVDGGGGEPGLLDRVHLVGMPRVPGLGKPACTISTSGHGSLDGDPQLQLADVDAAEVLAWRVSRFFRLAARQRLAKPRRTDQVDRAATAENAPWKSRTGSSSSPGRRAGSGGRWRSRFAKDGSQEGDLFGHQRRRGPTGGRSGRRTGVRRNVGKEADIQHLIETVEAEEPIDLFCSNAGIGYGGLAEVADERWQRIWTST